MQGTKSYERNPIYYTCERAKIFGWKFGNIMGEVIYSEYLAPPLPLPESGRGKY